MIDTSVEMDLNKHFSRYEDPLWKEEDNSKCLRIKRTSNKEKHTWKVFENNKVVFTFDSKMLTKKVVDFLLHPEGFMFVLEKYKSGCNTFEVLKKELKSYVKNIIK